MTTIHDLPTPALLLERDAFEHNLVTMARARPGEQLRPHVKAHKCTSLAKRQRAMGHHGFTCATAREVVGMARAGLGDDLLLANEIVDLERLRALAKLDARITIAVDSQETIELAARAGLREVVIDVNVGLPRCGIAPEQAGPLADSARRSGLTVRGVMGYEGHCVGISEREERERLCAESMQKLLAAFKQVGGELISAGATGTYDCNTAATEIQAGSYVLMDTAYRKLGLPFQQALSLWSSVVSVGEKHAVCDAGLKSLGMDHGPPELEGGSIWFCSDEHVTFEPEFRLRPGDRVRLIPAHCDPTVAYHETIHIVSGEEVIDSWHVDLRGW